MNSSRFSGKWTNRLVPFMLVLLVFAGCSSGDDTSATVVTDGPDETPATTAAPADTDTTDFDCEALGAHALVMRGANGWVPQIDSAEMFADFGGDLDAVDAAIEGLRPIQDIDGIFGTPREGLDNLAADIQAIRDDRYADIVGGYNTPAVSAVLAEEVCN